MNPSLIIETNRTKPMKLKNIVFFFAVLAMITATSMESKAQKKTEAKLRHVVLFKFKDSSQPEDIKRVEEAFAALPGKIKQIKDYEWGTNNSPEKLNQGLTHCFFLTFSSEQDRDAYLIHPDHKAFGAVLGPHLDKVTVVDYWTK
jgi:hypothetical protein